MSEAARPAGPAGAGPAGPAGARPAGPVEVWAARAWNVFNEGRPFSVVYPLLVLLAAAPLGLAPEGSLGLAARRARAPARSCCRASRSRCAAARCSGSPRWPPLPLLEPWRAPALLAGALAGYVFFTVVVWGSVYYHLRTGAPWTNGLRFWRLVLTNSDPTSGNALEQLPKLLIALSAGTLLAEEPSAGLAAADARPPWRSPRLWAPSPRARSTAACRAIRSGRHAQPGKGGARPARLRDRRGRLQPRPPLAGARSRDGPARPRGHGVPRGGARVSRAHGRLLLVDAHRRDTGRARHALELRSAPRRAARVHLRCARAPRPARPARGDRAPARPLRRGGSALGDLGAADLADRPLARGRGPTGGRGGGSRTCSCSSCSPPTSSATCAACAAPSTSTSSPRPTATWAASSASSRRRGRLDGATVILMADHGQGRGIGGHGHLDWGERPVPFVVWGEGAPPGRDLARAALGARAGRDDRPPARRSAARGRTRPAARAGGGRARWSRCTAGSRRALPRHRGRARRGAGRGRRARRHPGRAACGLPVDVLLVDDGSRDATAAIGREHGARVHSLRALARTRRRPAHRPRDRPRRGLRRRRLHRRRRRVRPRRLRARARAGRARTRRLRARLALPRPARGHVLAPDAREPLRRARCSELCSARSRATPRPATARSRPARSPPRASGTTTTTRRCSRSRCGAPASTRSRCRSATGAARADARSCATPSTSREWRPRSGASGAPRAPRAGPAAARPRPRRPPARTASRRRARTAAAGR